MDLARRKVLHLSGAATLPAFAAYSAATRRCGLHSLEVLALCFDAPPTQSLRMNSRRFNRRGFLLSARSTSAPLIAIR
jgi:hypothetical protein